MTMNTNHNSAAAVPDLRALAREGVVHFVGIGGAGMSALAELVLRAGGRVTGCDALLGESVRKLAGLGIALAAGHDPAHVADCVAVVTTSAVPDHHPELASARARGIPVLKRAQALGAIVNRGTVVALAGTHGKTTTTTMATAILAQADMDPTALAGGRVPAWGGGLRLGGDRLFVVEADEYDRSFLTLAPTVVVLTSVEADHLDIYGDLAGVEQAFAQFLAAVPEDGMIAACHDDDGARRVAARLGRPVLWYGIDEGAQLRAENITYRGTRSSFDVMRGAATLGRIDLGVPGAHNVRNALGAIAAASYLGASFDSAQRALAEFTGVARRFQPLGEAAGVVFIDDYAHHPTEIAATIAAARGAHPQRRIVAVFQPHLFSRTRDLAAEFGKALAGADVVYLSDIYPAREQPIPGVTGELLYAAVRAAGASAVHYHGPLAELEQALHQELRAGDVCLGMGAGDIDGVLRRVLAARAPAGAA
ncbi:MAG TPA: UDP-N-acetylmuramate--L-alanine ligase [Longimicrobiales bacterium]|nr:UDP-N-acetylmuramate--L-alanine ligase [Longimicrobiales bacterium]